MKKYLFVAISYALYLHLSVATSTLPVETRIAKLKEKLKAEIGPSNRKQAYDSYGSYGDETDFTILPIPPTKYESYRPKRFRPMRASNISHNVRIKKKRRRERTTTTVKIHTHKPKSVLREEFKAQKKISHGILYMINPMDIFYRRGLEIFEDESNRKWVHCQDLITPYITGIKKEPTTPKRLGATDAIPKKLFEMLSLETNRFQKDDVYTVVYQISKLQIRLFQWDVMPIRILMNLFTKGKMHTFRNLKHGLKELFSRWRLTFTNTTMLLEATQIIRPPCVVTSRYSGSTKSDKVSKFKDWTAKETTLCEADDWTCEERK